MGDQKITSQLVAAYWQCPRKAFFLLNESQQAVPHELDVFLNNYKCGDRYWYFRQLQDKFGDVPSYTRDILLCNKYPALFGVELEYEDLLASVDVLLKINNEKRNRRAVYVPVLVSGTHLVPQDQKIALAFAGIVLSRIQNSPCTEGKVLSANRKVHSVNFEKQGRQVQRIIRALRSWIQETAISPPDIFLNKHCSLCMFSTYCYSEARQIDHLSLLSGLSQKQIRDYNNKGIFTVTQLAYTYRSRKQKSQGQYQRPKYKHALKAMAIRDNRIYVVKSEEMITPYPHIFLDVEGIPEQNFHYLIGLLVVTDSLEKQYSFWANQEGDEESIWRQFLDVMMKYDDFTIFHYGSYERQFINTMAVRYGGENDSILHNIKSRLVNVLSLIYSCIYFPTYSNGLKEIGAYIGHRWTNPEASGLQSIVWRYRWEESKDEEWKNVLITYNREDCHALKRIAKATLSLRRGNQDLFEGTTVTEVETIKPESVYKFSKADFLLSDFDHINNCAYYDYQRERVFFRAEAKKRRQLTGRRKTRQRQHRINKQIAIPHPIHCEHCGKAVLYRHSRQRKVVFDIRFNRSGVKRWVVQYQTMRVKCLSCGKVSVSQDYHSIRSKYGHDFFSLIVYNSIAMRQSHGLISEGFKTLFGYEISRAVCNIARQNFAILYEETYQNILSALRQGTLVHADETTVKLRFTSGYIWVFTSMTKVAYVYSPTREGSIPKEHLAGFTGVLVSDFFSGYDALSCPKQRCIVHLIRDMNDDLRKNPFDAEFKLILQDFGILMRSILSTIDRFGLKSRYLHKHKKDVDKFYHDLLSRNLQSEIAVQYKNRLNKWKEELFTFLDHDGVPWNNNNAEHAVKMFAVHRKNGNGLFTEAGIKQFLILLSIYETCRCREIDFLDFLRSGGKNLLDYPSPIIRATEINSQK